MRLQSKMITIVGVIVLVTILVWVFVAEALFMGNYQQLERNDVQDALDATRYSLELSVGQMNETARDYASWDDTYSFVVNNNTNYITANLAESTFQNLQLNLLFIENTDGKIVVAKAYDLVNGSFVALPGELDRLASTDSPLFFHNESTGTSTGIFSTANGPLLVASQPILTSNREGPIHGTLLFGRYLTPDVLTAIAGPGKTVSAYPFGAQSLEQVQRVQPALAGGASSVIEPVNATNVAGFTLLRDLYGNPSLVIEEVLPRTIYQAGLSSTNTFLGLLVISGVISLTCMVWSLRQSVLAPLLRINTSLARIRTSDDLSKRVPERGDVELLWLAHAINATLASLESSHAERDATANQLLESEEMLRLTLNASEDAIALVDTNGVFLAANEALAHRFGVTAAEVIGMKGFTEKPEDIAKQRQARFARAIATKLPVHFDDEHAGRRLENVYQPVVDARGDVTKVAVFSRDVTERKQAEAEFTRLSDDYERQARMLDGMLAASAEPIFLLDPEGRFLYQNEASARAMGAKRSDSIGKTMRESELPTDITKQTEAEVNNVLATGQAQTGTIDFPVPDGIRNFEYVVSPVFDTHGDIEGVVVSNHDVTEHKRMQAAIAESEAQQRAIFESVQTGITLIDPTTHRIVDVNATAAHLFGAPKEAIIGLVCHRFICPAEEGRCPITDLGQIVDNAERVLLTADGKSRPILKSVSKITLGGHAYLLESFIDISNRKQMELALFESEQYYRAIFESTATGMAIVEEDMTVAKVNSILEQLTGFSKNEVEGLRLWTDFVAPEDLELMKTYHRTRRRDDGSAPKGYEFRLLTKDGTRREAFLTVALIPGTQRSVVSIVDLTALKTAQEAVRKQAAMLDAAHDCIMILDPEGTITYWNHGAERLYGWTKQEVTGQNANALLLTTFPESREKLWPKFMESGLWEGELIHVTRDGVPVTVTSSWTLLKDEKGNASAILEISSDITERKRAELARAESEAKLRTTFATMADGILIVGLDEKLTDCNEAILRLTQRSREEIIGKPFANLLAPEYRSLIPGVRRLLVGSILSRRSEPVSIRVNSQLLRKSRESIDIEANVSLIEDVAGQPAAFLIVARDVTERKQMEQQLENTLADLQRSNTELEEFAYIASHDLQEPLRMITSYIQLLEEDYKGKLDTDADQYVAFAVDGAKRMQTLINDLLAYSRVGTRGEPFLPTSTSSVLAEAIANLEVAIDESRAVVTHDQLPTVLGDESQLVQLLQNLLGNAIKFRSDDTPTIHVGVEETEDNWKFSVRDNGIGIEAKYAKRIFTVFQRLHSREEYPGTGIGLAVAKKIVERHGGRIWVDSAPEKGSTFYFTLPKRRDITS